MSDVSITCICHVDAGGEMLVPLSKIFSFITLLEKNEYEIFLKVCENIKIIDFFSNEPRELTVVIKQIGKIIKNSNKYLSETEKNIFDEIINPILNAISKFAILAPKAYLISFVEEEFRTPIDREFV